MGFEPFKLFCPYQLAWGADRAGVKLAEKSRRIGWTYFDAFDATISRIGSHPGRPYDLWYSATDMTAAVHSVNILQAVEQGIVERIRMRKEKLSDIPPVDETYRREWLAERRAECLDEDMWNEEYMCRPSSDTASLLTYDLIRGCERT